jgi:peroxiredoxin
MSERGPLDFEGDEEGGTPLRPHVRPPGPASEEEREEREARWALRRDPDLDGPAGSPQHPGGEAPTPRPPGYSQYGWFVGVVAVLLLGWIGINTLRNGAGESAGPHKGTLAPPFAAPLVFSSFADDADVNVARKDGQGNGAGNVAACSVTSPGVLNICRLYASKPVVLVFTATRGSQCIHQLDVIERLRTRLSGVSFAAIAIRGSRSDLRNLTRRHGWDFPVAYDHDGVLANLYGIAVCPQLTFIRRDGRVADTAVGVVEAAELTRRVRALGT